MSEDTQKTQPEQNEIVATPEECLAALEFWKYHNIPIPQALQKATDDFVANTTAENCLEVKRTILLAIAESDHEVFKSEFFQQVSKACSKDAFEMEFTKNFEEAMSEEKKEQK